MSTAPDAVKKLVDNFAEHVDHYKSHGYNETELRREYLDPFWCALGWDIDNRQGYADQYKDVIHEDAIKVGDKIKAPDYSFRIGGTRKFFLEAKKPSVNIQFDTAPAYQLRRYAWSAKLPLSVLSDFEEFSVYDCRYKPDPKDAASRARTVYMRFDHYLDRWDEIHGVFSRDAILRGSFDKYVVDNKRKRGTAEVDDVFLDEIEHWRELLAKNLVLRNDGLTIRDLNYAVQVIIDRIIFLRICEDRGTEIYGRLRDAVANKEAYAALVERFRDADARYNSGLFHFTGEKHTGSLPDKLTPTLAVDTKVLREIVHSLYYPESPYAFTVLPPDILGHVYEQFLGKTITLSGGEKRPVVKIEEKPEVRKAGGVYYTPTYIVDYIVENTLGRLLNGDDPDTPRPIPVSRAAELKVLDPACGSGSFLIVAYQYLLDWHRDQYTLDYGAGPDPATGLPPLDPNKIKRHGGGKDPKIFQNDVGEYRLTIGERKRILLNNIHGVDIDSQAVEVTKLSLLLKVIEGESDQVMQTDWILDRERILPNLGNNIQCGNSLIGPDFYAQPDLPELDDETRYRINVFDWKKAFPDVFAKGGFDCVIGNPPYVRQEGLKETKAYFSTHFGSASNTADLYVYFLEQALNVCRPAGLAAYIVSSSFLKTSFAKKLRSTLLDHAALVSIADFGGLPVFESAKDTYVCIPIFEKGGSAETVEVKKVNELVNPDYYCFEGNEKYLIPASRLTSDEWPLRSDLEEDLFKRITSVFPILGNSVEGIYYGIKTGLNEAFMLGLGEAKSVATGTDTHAAELLKRVAGGTDVRRYSINERDQRLLVIPSGWTQKHFGAGSEGECWHKFSQANPLLAAHLETYQEKLRRRQDQGDFWWELRPCDYYSVLEEPKIIFPDICKGPRFFLDNSSTFILNTAYAINSDSRYLLGILNSVVFWWLIAQISIPFGTRGGKFRYRLIYQYVSKVPIRPIDFDNPSDVAKHDKMVTLVDTMLDLHRRKADEKNPQTLRQLETQITATDSQIDALVYDLYDLTPDEIALVEAS